MNLPSSLKSLDQLSPDHMFNLIAMIIAGIVGCFCFVVLVMAAMFWRTLSIFDKAVDKAGDKAVGVIDARSSEAIKVGKDAQSTIKVVGTVMCVTAENASMNLRKGLREMKAVGTPKPITSPPKVLEDVAKLMDLSPQQLFARPRQDADETENE
jgi:hypothetical protein